MYVLVDLCNQATLASAQPDKYKAVDNVSHVLSHIALHVLLQQLVQLVLLHGYHHLIVHHVYVNSDVHYQVVAAPVLQTISNIIIYVTYVRYNIVHHAQLIILVMLV